MEKGNELKEENSFYILQENAHISFLFFKPLFI